MLLPLSLAFRYEKTAFRSILRYIETSTGAQMEEDFLLLVHLVHFWPMPDNSITRLAMSESNFSVSWLLVNFLITDIHIQYVLLLLHGPCSWFSLNGISLQFLQFYPRLC